MAAGMRQRGVEQHLIEAHARGGVQIAFARIETRAWASASVTGTSPAPAANTCRLAGAPNVLSNVFKGIHT